MRYVASAATDTDALRRDLIDELRTLTRDLGFAGTQIGKINVIKGRSVKVRMLEG